MPKLAEKQATKFVAARAVTTQPSLLPVNAASTKIRKEDGERLSKQARVVEMLHSPTGTTVAAVMKATGWQQHSVRGFFAGVVQKKLRLKLNSKKIDGNRIYRIVSASSARSSSRRARRPSSLSIMRRVTIQPASPDREKLDIEIARLRGLDVGELRARWHTVFRRRAPAHLPRHLLYRILAYRLQADRLGDLDAETLRFLDRSGSAADVGKLAIEFNQRRTDLKVGTLLVREWDGQLHRVMVLADGFAWHDKVFPSLSKVAFTMTGTRWNGPRFFGLRDNPSTER